MQNVKDKISEWVSLYNRLTPIRERGKDMAEQAVLENTTNNKGVVLIRENEYELLSLNEARKMLGIGINKMYKLVNSGEIPYVSGFGGRKIRKGAIYDFILQHEQCAK